MVEIKNIEAGKYNKLLAEALKESGDFEAPEWVSFVKTGTHKIRPVIEEDFWHKRVASILRQIYLNGIVGVERLRTRYGGRKERGGKPSRYRKSGGKIIRVALQQAEKTGLVEKAEGLKKGRQLTAKGKELLESIKESE